FQEPEVPVTEAFSLADEHVSEPIVDEVPAATDHVVEATAAGSYFDPPATHGVSASSTDGPAYRSNSYDNDLDDDYHLTVINDSNSREKNGLLLGATILMVTLLLTGVVVSIFGKSFDIGAIGEDNSFTWIPDIEPVAIDEPEIKQKKDNSGG